MSHTIQTQSLRDMAAQDRLGMFRLRAEVFSQRLGWDVQLTDDGLEIDPFDQVDTARYIIARDPLGRVDAC